MITKERIEELMSESIGSLQLWKRPPFAALVYTDGVMNLQKEANMFWFVDMVGTHTPEIIKDYQNQKEDEKDGFYLVNLKVNEDHSARFWINREVYDEEEDKYKYPIISEQNIEYADLPECDLQFFLELKNEQPLRFCLLCHSEH